MQTLYQQVGVSGQYRPATHAEILDLADKIRNNLALDPVGKWESRELYIAKLRAVLSPDDEWLLDAGLLFEPPPRTAAEERALMVQIISKDWFGPLQGLRRTNRPALKRLAMENGVPLQGLQIDQVEILHLDLLGALKREVVFLESVQARMPQAACRLVEERHVLHDADGRPMPVTSLTRAVLVTVTDGIVEAHRALAIQ